MQRHMKGPTLEKSLSIVRCVTRDSDRHDTKGTMQEKNLSIVRCVTKDSDRHDTKGTTQEKSLSIVRCVTRDSDSHATKGTKVMPERSHTVAMFMKTDPAGLASSTMRRNHIIAKSVNTY